LKPIYDILLNEWKKNRWSVNKNKSVGIHNSSNNFSLHKVFSILLWNMFGILVMNISRILGSFRGVVGQYVGFRGERISVLSESVTMRKVWLATPLYMCCIVVAPNYKVITKSQEKVIKLTGCYCMFRRAIDRVNFDGSVVQCNKYGASLNMWFFVL